MCPAIAGRIHPNRRPRSRCPSVGLRGNRPARRCRCWPPVVDSVKPDNRRIVRPSRWVTGRLPSEQSDCRSRSKRPPEAAGPPRPACSANSEAVGPRTSSHCARLVCQGIVVDPSANRNVWIHSRRSGHRVRSGRIRLRPSDLAGVAHTAKDSPTGRDALDPTAAVPILAPHRRWTNPALSDSVPSGLVPSADAMDRPESIDLARRLLLGWGRTRGRPESRYLEQELS